MPKKKSATVSRDKSTGKLPNIYDVAREADVSVFTVSAVINNAKVGATSKRRVQAAIEKLNYRPNLVARGLAKRKTFTVGVIVPDISNPFFPQVVRGAEDVLQKSGYSALLCNSDDQPTKEEHYLEFLMSRRVDGILLAKTPAPISEDLRKRLRESKIPIVMLMRTSPDISEDVVLSDDGKGAFDAASHLAGLGYESIALVGGPSDVSNAKERRDGFLKALALHQVAVDPKLMFAGDYRMDSGYRAGLALLPRRPQAVVIANYMMMVGFMKAAEEIGLRCPEDFAVASFDDYPWLGFFHPRMTTVELPKYEIGAQAAEILLERINDPRGKPKFIKLAAQLRVRESCGFALRTHRNGALRRTAARAR
jgi:LacI family transcriptional regulator